MIRAAFLAWTVLSLFEIVLIGRLDAEETPVGIAIALLATAAMLSAASLANVRYRLRWRWLWLLALVARNVLRDTAVVYGVLFRRLTGAAVDDVFIRVPFDPGSDDAASAARRALAVAGVSTSPNEIVLDIDHENRTLVVHALTVTNARRRSERWPL